MLPERRPVKRIRVREYPFSIYSHEQTGQMPLSPSERLRIIHSKETESSLKQTKAFKDGVEQLKHSTSVGQILQDAESLAIQTVFGTPGMPDVLQDEIQNILQTITPAADGKTHPHDKLIAAVINHNFKDIDDDSPEYLALLQANAIKEFVSRALIREIAQTTTLLTPVQKEILLYGTQIADVVDEAHIQWWQETHQGEAFSKIKELKARGVTEQDILEIAGLPPREGDLPNQYDYMYFMFRQKTNGDLTIVPYSDESAFGEHIRRIEALTIQMEDAMRKNPEVAMESAQIKGLLATQRAWVEQLKATDPREQKRLADIRDTIWMQEAPAHIGDQTSIQIIYGMESYSAPLPLVQWEYNIAIPDDRYEYLNKRAREAQKAMVGYFATNETEFPANEYPALKNSVSLMESSSALVYALVKSGAPLGFLFAATNIPNTAAIRLVNGSKIFENRKTFSERANIAQRYISKLFENSAESLERYNNLDDAIDMLAGVFVPLHEVGHNLSVGPQTRELLSPSIQTNIEEAKADLAGIVGSFALLEKPEDKELFITALFMEELRGLTRRKEHEDRSHLHGNILNIQLMIDAGILIKRSDGNWEFNLTHGENGTINKFHLLAKTALQKLAMVYEHPSQQAGQAFIDNNFSESAQLLDLEYRSGIIETQEEFEAEIAARE